MQFILQLIGSVLVFTGKLVMIGIFIYSVFVVGIIGLMLLKSFYDKHDYEDYL